MNSQPKSFPKFKVDRRKVVEAILYVLHDFIGFTQYDIVKTIFLADKSHLQKYGRPITFDTYFAMKNGPVPSFAYDLLKPDFDVKRAIGEERPWISVPDVKDKKINRFVGTKREADTRYLSPTDMEVLKEAAGTIQLLDFDQIYRLTHDDPAYIEAWSRRGDSDRAQIDMALLGATEDQLSDLIYISKHTA